MARRASGPCLAYALHLPVVHASRISDMPHWQNGWEALEKDELDLHLGDLKICQNDHERRMICINSGHQDSQDSAMKIVGREDFRKCSSERRNGAGGMLTAFPGASTPTGPHLRKPLEGAQRCVHTQRCERPRSDSKGVRPAVLEASPSGHLHQSYSCCVCRPRALEAFREGGHEGGSGPGALWGSLTPRRAEQPWPSLPPSPWLPSCSCSCASLCLPTAADEIRASDGYWTITEVDAISEAALLFWMGFG
ncbi:hypothetical protein H920_02883 [Fukomys damarensis]|uniref:Uncharacterized protein n=1 Tax=Fukomys damarensis TaxID=885580 RepID=A0A091DU60_FUKDA|nr:hypothetical protein H920_02883 [Fukomys damarensis]